MSSESQSCSCCGPSVERSDPGETRFEAGTPRSFTLVLLPGGTFRMGSDADEGEPSDGEGPSRLVTLDPFSVDSVAVSNRRFAAFVEDTGYVTEAEHAGWSFVFAGLLPDDFPPTRGVEETPWWREVLGANWRCPEGPGLVD